MDSMALQACLSHLATAEMLLEEAGDLPSLARLSHAIDLLRRSHGLSDRQPAADDFWYGLSGPNAIADPGHAR